ncbi:uncharacterized protein LOC100840025 [Brachypodium distachyon]|uniref:Uncharacterized protein n=1 Tax=Brachypodium distachyon TaxID=15368 RepID=I1IBN1_BRADI|nr:uncharacterized protein LOC100840025 [Brachypodium distachyon]KQK00372.1 hypothetical protein BRADI_3g48935v3 [Brachypodium distachyon]|eukprot:XP_003572720.1 uncharacterized protein LOC100840025 [Brachypodium distachyon]
MDARAPRHQRLRTPRGPPTPNHPRNPSTPGQNPSRSPAAAPRSVATAMEDDAITMLMDIDDSPRSASGAGFLDDDDEGDLLHSHRVGFRGNEVRGPLPFAGFFNTFDGADFDDSDLA